MKGFDDHLDNYGEPGMDEESGTVSDEYTPPTEEVREDWVSAAITPSDYYDALSEKEARARWNRWLERVKAEAKAEALEEAAESQQFSDNWNRALYHDEHRSMLRKRATAIRAAAENGEAEPHRLLRECSICGEKTTRSNATEAWEKRHQHEEATHD